MASDRSFHPANESCYEDTNGTIGRAALVRKTHDQFNHIDRITTPTPSDHGTQPPTSRTHYSPGILQSYCNVPRRRFAGDLGLAPYKFHQDRRDGLHSSFALQPSIFTEEKPQTVVEPLSETALFARLSLYSSPDIPRRKPVHAQARAQTYQPQAVPNKKTGAVPQSNQMLLSDEPGSPTNGKTTIKATERAEKASKRRRCSSLFNKSFSFGPASRSRPFQASPQISPRSSISSESLK
jgi:hypothetical protein